MGFLFGGPNSAGYGPYPYSPIQPNSYDPYQAPYGNNPYQAPYGNNPYQAQFANNPYQAPYGNNPYQGQYVYNPYHPQFATNPYQAPYLNNPYQAPYMYNSYHDPYQPYSSPYGLYENSQNWLDQPYTSYQQKIPMTTPLLFEDPTGEYRGEQSKENHFEENKSTESII